MLAMLWLNHPTEVREQLSGACTAEIASFDEFASHLSGGGAQFDHITFDTAPLSRLVTSAH